MRYVIVSILTGLLFLTGTTTLNANKDTPWRELPEINDIKKYYLISAELKDMSDDGVKKNDTLCVELVGDAGLSRASLMFNKTKNVLYKEVIIDITNKDKIGLAGSKTWQIYIRNNSCEALYMQEQRGDQPVFKNIKKTDPAFMPEIPQFYKDAEKIFLDKIKDQKIKKFIQTLK